MIIIKILKIKVTENVIFSFAGLIFVMKTFLRYSDNCCSASRVYFSSDMEITVDRLSFFCPGLFRNTEMFLASRKWLIISVIVLVLSWIKEIPAA